MDDRGDNNDSDKNWGWIKADVTEIGDKTGCTNAGIAVDHDSETPETQHEPGPFRVI
jgi:hypothetical protein